MLSVQVEVESLRPADQLHERNERKREIEIALGFCVEQMDEW